MITHETHPNTLGVEDQLSFEITCPLVRQKSLVAKPFLKWAGGKSQLLEQMMEYFPQELKTGKIKHYVEPFIGGGAVFLHIAQTYGVESFFIFDINEELVVAYKTIREDVGALLTELAEMEHRYLRLSPEEQSDYFYAVRNQFNADKGLINYESFTDDWIKRTAQIIFLNKTCFNGLFRLNSKGLFNVPFGRYKKPTICQESNLLEISKILAKTEIRTGDFEECAQFIDSSTFVYFDPPYRPISKTSSFTSYSKHDFGDDAQLRLASFYRRLDSLGAKLMLSNSDPKNENAADDFFDKAYSGYRIELVKATRMINCNADKRGHINELLILNY